MTFFYSAMGRVLWGSRSIGELTQRQADSIRSKRKVGRIFYSSSWPVQVQRQRTGFISEREGLGRSSLTDPVWIENSNTPLNFLAAIGRPLLDIGPPIDLQLPRLEAACIHLIVIFGICWLPYQSYFIYTHFDPAVLYNKYVQHVYLGFYWLAMANAMVNPIIYYWMNAK
ncbi:hypothetical protein MSG28_003017 [Choristoneura fumiferana]|uniref:Uncharacterized protein n=1 Tax=Choristoneura fumiferana TaxID=7141 RepID=A0ACC0JKK9_CHOFU|nr:hypothetical protein MSG28_003017 [Choristoneura fumiferana]